VRRRSALWTGILAPEYGQDVGVVGVVAMAPASDLPGLVANRAARSSPRT
jgi:hypothetical protein